MSETCWLLICPRRPLRIADRPACRYRRDGKPCRDIVYRDDWLVDLAAVVRSGLYVVDVQEQVLDDLCESCGKTWRGSRRAMSKASGNIRRHKMLCADLDPEGRRRTYRRESIRIVTRPRKTLEVTLDADHPGLKGD